jgi:pyrroline-5-carboxylate reductase
MMKIAIIGCGHMGAAIAQKLSTLHQIALYDHNYEKSTLLEEQGFGQAYKDLKKALNASEAIILAVKPQSLVEVAKSLHGNFNKTHTLLSVLAGTSISTLHQYFPSIPIIRIMPNLAISQGEGIVGLSTNEKLKKKDKEEVTQLFEPLGKVLWLPENKLNALTSLASSGPAFVFAIFESMVDAGIAMGFNLEESKMLVHQMIKGSLSLLENTERHPGELKWQVASPGGTTIAGLKKLEEFAVRGAIMNTFLAAYEKAQQF